MGHTPGFPCIQEDPNHDGRCSSLIVGPFVDFAQTRVFEVTETQGRKAFWRTNRTAVAGNQVEFRHPSGWASSLMFDTEAAFLRSVARYQWREITGEEVPGA